VKIAVILPPTASSFRSVAGLPLIQRTVLCALQCGFDRVIVLAKEHAAQLHALLQTDRRTRGVEITDQLPAVEASAVAVIPSDYLVTTATLARVTGVGLDGRPLLFKSAARPALALCRPAMLAGIDLGSLSDTTADGVWAELQRRGAQSVPLDGELCVPISDAASVTAAEKALCRRLRADTAASDGPLAHWIDRRVSLRISRWLVRHTHLRPNHITVIGTCVGLLAAAVLSQGGYWPGVAGTLLFLCATIIDGCDGEVARMTLHTSAFGQKFDVITDNIVHVAIFIGLAAGLYHQNPNGRYVLASVILLSGFACDGVVSYFFLVRRPGFARSRGALVSWKGKVRQGLLQGFEAMMNRDFAYVLLGFALFGRLGWFFWGTAFGTYLFAILLVWVYRWREAA
jgi:phosphatidylglycerophosphate synthase